MHLHDAKRRHVLYFVGQGCAHAERVQNSQRIFAKIYHQFTIEQNYRCEFSRNLEAFKYLPFMECCEREHAC